MSCSRRIASFLSLSPDTPQNEIQVRLAEIHSCADLSAAMHCLFKWELKAGYITERTIEEVERLSFHDPATGLDFRIQVNYARSRYSASQNLKRDSKPQQGCLLCKDNMGKPGKEALRIYQFDLSAGRRFYVQLTPFPLHPYHFVLILDEHTPQNIDGQSVRDMLDFAEQVPGYTVCSNSDVEWAGSSILNHLHYQVFRQLHLPVLDALPHPEIGMELGSCRIDYLVYPLTAFRIGSSSREALQRVAGAFIKIWKAGDPGRNTVNLVLEKRGEEASRYILTVLLRNPDFRTTAEYLPYKSEGVGVIEASGEGILPVPSGPDAGQRWDRIRRDGLAIIKGIIEANSPSLEPSALTALLQEVKETGA